jgi:hypothetical protein
MTSLIKLILINFSTSAMLLGFLLAFLCIIKTNKKDTTRVAVSEALIKYQMLMTIGVSGIYFFLLYGLFPEKVAQHVDWPASPFQFFVAAANLGIGVIGIFGYWEKYGFRLAVTLMASCFYLGAAAVHLFQIFQMPTQGFANSGSMFYMDLAIPFILIVLLRVRYLNKGDKK